MEQKSPMQGVLSGFRVLDLSVFIQAPLSSAMLGDMGADVIKIEMPGVGDYSRGGVMLHGRDLRLPGNTTLFYEVFNRNKRAITLNLANPKGKEVLYRLVEKSDVLVVGLQPSSLKQIGADKESVVAHNSQIIYAQASGFGPLGPDSNLPANDPVGCARSGFMYNFGKTPNYAKGGVPDVMAATSLAFGITTALFARDRFGVAPSVNTSLLGAMTWLQYFGVAAFNNLGGEFEPWNREVVDNPFVNFYRCADDKWIMMGLYTDVYWHQTKLCEVFGIKHLQNDPKFTTQEARRQNSKELTGILDRAFAEKPSADWAKVFRENELVFSVVNQVADLATDTQVIANDYIVEFENELKMSAFPFKMDKSNIPLRKGAPQFGQHTEEVLIEVGGYDWPEIEEMRDNGVI
jgi:crotonobetainyl-CoA:carnitine CoA-transferase CaiB-like acyl-CoA transferase